MIHETTRNHTNNTDNDSYVAITNDYLRFSLCRVPDIRPWS
jgi:hypothetical protein